MNRLSNTLQELERHSRLINCLHIGCPLNTEDTILSKLDPTLFALFTLPIRERVLEEGFCRLVRPIGFGTEFGCAFDGLGGGGHEVILEEEPGGHDSEVLCGNHQRVAFVGANAWVGAVEEEHLDQFFIVHAFKEDVERGCLASVPSIHVCATLEKQFQNRGQIFADLNPTSDQDRTAVALMRLLLLLLLLSGSWGLIVHDGDMKCGSLVLGLNHIRLGSSLEQCPHGLQKNLCRYQMSVLQEDNQGRSLLGITTVGICAGTGQELDRLDGVRVLLAHIVQNRGSIMIAPVKSCAVL